MLKPSQFTIIFTMQTISLSGFVCLFLSFNPSPLPLPDFSKKNYMTSQLFFA